MEQIIDQITGQFGALFVLIGAVTFLMSRMKKQDKKDEQSIKRQEAVNAVRAEKFDALVEKQERANLKRANQFDKLHVATLESINRNTTALNRVSGQVKTMNGKLSKCPCNTELN